MVAQYDINPTRTSQQMKTGACIHLETNFYCTIRHLSLITPQHSLPKKLIIISIHLFINQKKDVDRFARLTITRRNSITVRNPQ